MPFSSSGRNAYLRLKKAHAEGRVIVYINESACYFLPFLAHTRAPKSKTPLVVEQAGRPHLSLIAVIAPNGRIYVGGQNQAFCSDDILWFLDRLCSRYRKRNLLMIWDGAAVHHSQAVKDWLSQRPGRVHLERIPAYIPDRIADAVESGRVGLESLEAKLTESGVHQFSAINSSSAGAIEATVCQHNLITVFFRKKEVAFFIG